MIATALQRTSVRTPITAAVAIAMLTGCASWPDERYRPELPPHARMAFVDQVWTTVNGGKDQAGVRALTFNDYKDTLRLLTAQVMSAAEQKNDQVWDTSMTTLVGGAAVAIGALAGKAGLLNTGIAVGTGGQVARTYYQPDAIRLKHMRLHAKLACISSQVAGFSEFKRRWAMAAAVTGSDAASHAMPILARSIDSVLTEYRLEMMGMLPQPVSAEDLMRFVQDYQRIAHAAKQAAEDGKPAPGAVEDPVEAPKAAASQPVGAASAAQPAASGAARPAAGAASGPAAQAPRAAASAAESTAVATGSAAESRLSSDVLPGAEPDDRSRYLRAGERYAKQFIPLQVNLEACVKGVKS